MTHTHPTAPPNAAHDHPHGASGPKLPGRHLAVGLALLLAACGGGGGGSTAPAPGGGNSPTAYYLSGPSGVDTGSGLGLSGVNPATAALVAIPSAGLLRIPGTTLSTGLWELAALPQWTVSAGSASAIGTRLRVWAGTENRLYSTDHLVVAGASAPVTAQVSNLSMASVCPGAPTVLRDYANPANSALVFRDAAISCGAFTDQFLAVPMSAGPSTSPAAASLNEPVDVVRDATGAIKQVLWIMHGSTPVEVGVSAGLGAAPVSLGALAGHGFNVNIPSGDFASLAVVPQADGSSVWVFRDTSNITAVNTKTGGAPVTVFQKKDADTLSLPVVVDGTNVFLAWTDDQNPAPNISPVQYTCQLIRIATAGALSQSSGVIVLNENTLGSGGITTGELPIGLSLVGVSGNYIVYFNNGITGGSGTVLLEAVTKTSSGLTHPTIAIDSALMPAQFNTATAPVTVANGVYYNLAAVSGNSTQTYFYNLAVNSGRLAVGGPNGSVLLGGVLANPAAATPLSSPAYASVLIAEPTANSSLSGATILGFDGNGFNGAVLGTLPTLNQASYTGAALSDAPLQAGMPALLEISGVQTQSSNNATDLFEITPGTGASLQQVTKNLQ